MSEQEEELARLRTELAAAHALIERVKRVAHRLDAECEGLEGFMLWEAIDPTPGTSGADRG